MKIINKRILLNKSGSKFKYNILLVNYVLIYNIINYIHISFCILAPIILDNMLISEQSSA